MKKSGSLSSFALFGFTVETMFLLFTFLLFDYNIFSWKALVAIIISTFMFIGYRHMIEWTVYNNPLEDQLRRIAISEYSLDKMLFATFGGYVIFLANYQISSLPFLKIFFAGFFATLTTNVLFESIRTKINQHNASKILKKNNTNGGTEIWRVKQKHSEWHWSLPHF